MAWRIAIGSTATEAQTAGLGAGNRLYVNNCSACHGAKRNGNAASGFPSLLGIATRKTRDYVKNVVAHGKGMMPAFTKFSEKEKDALVAFLYEEENGYPD